jgi:hypothetical protein
MNYFIYFKPDHKEKFKPRMESNLSKLKGNVGVNSLKDAQGYKFYSTAKFAYDELKKRFPNTHFQIRKWIKNKNTKVLTDTRNGKGGYFEKI